MSIEFRVLKADERRFLTQMAAEVFDYPIDERFVKSFFRTQGIILPSLLMKAL
jgi:hypothetical protein